MPIRLTVCSFFSCLCFGIFTSLFAGADGIARVKSGNAEWSLKRPITVALADQGKRLLVANRDSGEIFIVDTKSLMVVSTTRIGKRLSDMVVSPGGKVVLVTDDAANELLLLARKANSIRVLQRLKTEITPVSVCLDAKGHIASVACLWPRRLMIFDLTPAQKSGRKAPAVIDLPFAPREQLILPGSGKLLVADSFGGNLALINLRGKKVESVRGLPVHNIRGLALGRGQNSVLLSHQMLFSRGRPTPGEIRSTNLIANQIRRLRMENVVNPLGHLTRQEEQYFVGDIDRGAGDPAGVAESHDGAILLALAGVNEFAIGRPKQALWTRLPVGRRPTAIALDNANRRAYVANTLGDSISVVDLNQRKVITHLLLDKREKQASALPAHVRGEMLFFDARLSLDGWYSCHSCHTDGHTNGRLNDNFTDGSFGTPKRVLSLLGVKDTGKWAWSGHVPKLESQVRQSLQSTMQGPAPKDGQVRDLIAYLQTLEPPPSIAKARSRLNHKAIARGRKVFEERRCSSCHKPPTYTSPKTYDGGVTDETGNSRFNPPSLRGLSQAGPFFHDNRARTLEEVFTRFRHRLKQPLPKKDLNDLLHFLRSI